MILKLAYVALVALVSCAATPTAVPEPAAEPYNLVYIMADDLGKEWISCYGAEDIETPHIDALAATGMLFHNFYCMPQCTPTRASLLTGQYPYRHGWVNHWDVPRWGGGCNFDPEANPSFPRAIRDAGYATAAAGKWQIDDFRVEADAMHEAGFSAYCMWTGYEAQNRPSAKRYQDPYVYEDGAAATRTGEFGPDVFTDYLVEFIGENKDRPMFIYYPMVLPHGPLVATPDEPEASSPLERHKAMVRYIDSLVGRLVAAIDDHGIRERTIVVFTTDNGSTRSITGTRRGIEVQGAKAMTTESGVNVPFIASCPGRIASGAESNALIDITDIAPTFCEVAGETPSAGLHDGRSFMDVLDGRAQRSSRSWIMAMGGGNHAKLTDAGVENQYWFRDRVLRNERFKAFIGTNGDLWKLTDLQSATPHADIQHHESVEVQRAKKMFLDAVASMPAKDADPIYKAAEPRDWYLQPSAKSQTWKRGAPVAAAEGAPADGDPADGAH